eukprot:TRINITY_DN647_c0_g1_i6.p1 TRINITY_DN647_c0_g1~~TRINITY_DN647_c0_g1_i6.p1  ORF type:complete len:103 (-),score=9.14 TRINITY_DN647_c0_g1_i6:151-459(-)
MSVFFPFSTNLGARFSSSRFARGVLGVFIAYMAILLFFTFSFLRRFMGSGMIKERGDDKDGEGGLGFRASGVYTLQNKLYRQALTHPQFLLAAQPTSEEQRD